MLAWLGLGQTELVIILVVVFILFGHRLPSVMQSLGHGMVNFWQDSIYDQRRWPQEPLPRTLDMYVIGIGVFLLLAILAVVLGQVLFLR